MKRKDKILETALALFNEKGVSEVGVREVAREMSISVGNLSYHFPKKDDVIFALLGQMRDRNTAFYQAYFAQSPGLEGYLHLAHRIFENQFAHRGILVGNAEVKKITQSVFDYQSVKEKRLDSLRTIFQQLEQAGELEIGEENLEELVNMAALFFRFWLHEAFIDEANLIREDLIPRYLQQWSWQLSLFATEKGKEALKRFWKENS